MYENIIQKINNNVIENFKNKKWIIALSIILLTIIIISIGFYIHNKK